MSEIFEKLDDVALTALVARNLPRLRATDVFTADDNEAGRECLAIADTYFAKFVGREIGKKNDCVCCGAALTGLFVGAFTWGLAHGEGFCRNCGYPARAIHHIDGVGRIANLVLQYHPSELTDARAVHVEVVS